MELQCQTMAGGSKIQIPGGSVSYPGGSTISDSCATTATARQERRTGSEDVPSAHVQALSFHQVDTQRRSERWAVGAVQRRVCPFATVKRRAGHDMQIFGLGSRSNKGR